MISTLVPSKRSTQLMRLGDILVGRCVESQVADSRPHTARMVAAAFGQKKGPTRWYLDKFGEYLSVVRGRS